MGGIVSRKLRPQAVVAVVSHYLGDGFQLRNTLAKFCFVVLDKVVKLLPLAKQDLATRFVTGTHCLEKKHWWHGWVVIKDFLCCESHRVW